MILVIGSTGNVGSEICRLLIAKNLRVRAMVRNTSDPLKTKKLEELGVQLVEGDLRDKSTFPNMLEGVTTIVSTASSMPFSYSPGENDIRKVDEEGLLNLIDAAKMAGVKHFIYTSFSKNIDMDFPLRNAKRNVEKHLQNSGMSYTVLRPSYYMEVWLSPAGGFDPVNGHVNILGNGNQPISYISFKDVAKFAVECISNPIAVNSVFELGGPENLSQIEALKIFSEALQKTSEINFLSPYLLKEQFDFAEDDMQKSFVGLMICAAKGDSIAMFELLSKFPVKLTSVKEFVQTIAQLELVHEP